VLELHSISFIKIETSLENSLPPNEEVSNNFTLDYSIYSIEIIPTRFQGQGTKERLVGCGEARVKQELNCYE